VPARIVMVHDDEAFLTAAASALTAAGYDAALFSDPMAALDVLIEVRTAELLITRIEFGPGKPNGVALARIARVKRPGIKILFTASPEHAEHAAGLGMFLPMPVDPGDLMGAVGQLLEASARSQETLPANR
jgi:DNA-binding NtrC family response regulator